LKYISNKIKSVENENSSSGEKDSLNFEKRKFINSKKTPNIKNDNNSIHANESGEREHIKQFFND
jgi:hypothetical protein